MVVGEFTQETDLAIIGGGPAGYSAAFRAAELGVQTTLIDARADGALGGVCLHEGCVPSKTLLHIAETIHQAQRAEEFGVTLGEPKMNLQTVADWAGKATQRLARGLESLCKKHGVDRVIGRAHFEDSRTLAVLESTVPRIRFKRAVIATGSIPRLDAELPFDDSCVLTPHRALEPAALERMPKSLLIVGDDYVAAELATIFSALGSKVTMALTRDRLLPDFDEDLVRSLQKRLTAMTSLREGWRPRLEKITSKGAMIQPPPSGGDRAKPIVFERVIVCGNHIGNTRSLQLDRTDARVDENDFVIVDRESLRTADRRIFAVGDSVGAPLLADKALAQGRIVGEIAAGWNSVFDARAIPLTIFTDPQIACVGLMEEQAARQKIPCEVSRMPWGASGRAVGMGRSADGLTKIVYDRDTKLVLGVGMVGPHACEMIGEAALAIEMGAALDDLAATMHPHPSMVELISDAARAAREA